MDELRVWSKHLRSVGLTVEERDVQFDEEGMSEPLTQEEFDTLSALSGFVLEKPAPFDGSGKTVPSRFPMVRAGEEISYRQAMNRARGISLPEPLEDETEALPEEGEAPPWTAQDAGFVAEHDTDHTLALLRHEDDGYQHPAAATLLGLEEEETPSNPADSTLAELLTQFDSLPAEDRAELVLNNDLSREQLDALFNHEGQGRRNKKALSAITTALQRIPNKGVDSINEALVKASATEG